MAAVQRYVDTASAGGDGTTQGHSGGTAAYASLSSWESSEQTNLTTGPDTHTVSCAGSTADATATTIEGWTTSTTAYITVEGDRSAPDSDGFYGGTNALSTSHYRMVCGNNTHLTLGNNVVVDGIQVYFNASVAFRYGIAVQPQNGGLKSIYRCRIVDQSASSPVSNTFGIRIFGQNMLLSLSAADSNLIVGFDYGIWGDCDSFSAASGGYGIYNNTIYEPATYGIFLDRTGTSGSNTWTWETKNNVVWGAATENYDENGTTLCTYTTDTNAFNVSPTDATTNEIVITGTAADTWASPGLTAGSDFHVKDASSEIANVGIQVGEATDADDVTRTSAYDIGAFDFVTAGAIFVFGDINFGDGFNAFA